MRALDLTPRGLALGVTGVLVALVMAVFGGLTVWSQGPGWLVAADRFAANRLVAAGFAVRRVVVDGRDRTPTDAVLAAVRRGEGGSILHLDLADAARALENLAWVERAEIARLLPDVVRVRLQERRAAGVWIRPDRVVLIDAMGRVVASKGSGGPHYAAVDPARDADLPRMVGANADQGAVELFALLESAPRLAARLKAAERVGARRWNLRLKDGPVVMLPETDADRALARLTADRDRARLLGPDILSLDLRYEGDFVVRLRDVGADVTRARGI